MSPRPLHRWKSFWLGILALAFLGWSWIASMEVAGVIGIDTPLFDSGAAYTNGSLMLFCNGSSRDFHVGWARRAEAGQTWLPSPIEASYSRAEDVSSGNTEVLPDGTHRMSIQCGYSPAHGHIRIAHWLLIPIFLLIWSAFLHWRVRRIKHLASSP